MTQTNIDTDEVERMVRQIKLFGEEMNDPRNWTICVPEHYFDAVKNRLIVDESGLGTKYRGAALCYTESHADVWIEYAATLSHYQDTSDL